MTLDVGGTTQTEQLNVTGVSTFQDNVNLGDNDKLLIGTGNDLQIYHDGSNSYVQEGGTGALRLVGNQVAIRNNAENMAVFNTNADVQLYYDNSKKFETTGIGISVSSGTALTATIAGPSNLIIDPGIVGDNTGIVRIKGDLFVDGTQTQINSTTIELADFIVGIATTATSDLLTDGAGIQIGPDNTFLYEFNGGTNPSLKSSENLNVASGKVYQIAETERLSADTLSLGTGTTIYSPASNTLTLGTNGNERLRITSDGKIGINSASPETGLDIRSDDGIFVKTVTNGGTGSTGGAKIQFTDHSDGSQNQKGHIIYKHPDNSISPGSNDGFLIGGTETLSVVRIEGRAIVDEKVGIVTNTTTAGLTLYSASSTDPLEREIRIDASDAPSGGNSYGYFRILGDGNASGKFLIGYNNAHTTQPGQLSLKNADGDITFFNANNSTPTEKLRITSDGKVGIGTDDPAEKLDVRGDIIFHNNVIMSANASSTNIDHIWHDDNASLERVELGILYLMAQGRQPETQQYKLVT